jgi:PAS domain S-box-containing protein
MLEGKEMGQARDERSIEKDLKKRLQELDCLYRTGIEIESDNDLAEVLRNITTHLVAGLKVPESAASSIWFDGVEYSSRPLNRAHIVESFGTDIVVEGRKRGTVEAYYEKRERFLEEEKTLITEIGHRLSKAIERRELHSKVQYSLRQVEEFMVEKTRELEKSKNRYKNFFTDAPMPMLISRPDGDITKANRAFYRLFGYPEDGSMQLNMVRDKLYEKPEVRSMIFDILQNEGKLEDFEVTLLDRNGNPIPFIASYIWIDVDGELSVESVYKDLRIRKQLEKKLIEQNENLERNVRERTLDLEKQKDLLIKKNQELMTLSEKLLESKTRLQALFNTITDTVTVIDKDFNVLMSNQKAIGNRGKCYKKVFGQERPCEDCLVRRVLEEKTSVTLEKVIDGEYYLLQAYPILNSSGEVTGALEISRIITKEKNMERQLLQADKLASLGQLVSGIAHEINNPNTFIRGNLYIIQEAMNDIFPFLDQAYKSNPDLKIARLNYDIFRQNVPVLIDDMAQGANRIKGIVDGLRKFAKHDEGILNENVDINAITESCLRLVDDQIRRTANVKVNLEPNVPTITGNTQKLQQVIVNILINASQAIEKSKGTIIITSEFNDGEVILRVRDDGRGMDEKTLKQMFDPFFTTKRHQGGTGLGLSIAYGIIKEHKGRIDVESKVGVGTSFCICLPITQAEV